MSRNIAELQRELNVYLMEGNDYMADKIQKLIDDEFKRRNVQNLDEVVGSETDTNIQSLNE